MDLLNTILYILGIACAIWVIYDVFANQKKMTVGMKVLWTVLAIVFSVITAIVYYFLVYTKKKKR